MNEPTPKRASRAKTILLALLAAGAVVYETAGSVLADAASDQANATASAQAQGASATVLIWSFFGLIIAVVLIVMVVKLLKGATSGLHGK